MSSVFAGEIIVPRAVADPGTDHSLPPSGSLSYGSITSLTALAGTDGVNTSLITGDKWQQLNGQHTENVSENHLLTIQGNRQEMISGDHTHTIVGNTNATHIGTHNQTNISPRNDTFAHTRTEVHSEEEHQQQPTGRKESTAEESTNTEKESHFKQFEYMVTGVSMEAKVVATEYKRVAVGVVNMGADFVVMKSSSKAFEENLGALASEVKGVKLKAAASHAKAVAANLNAGLAGNADSPLA